VNLSKTRTYAMKANDYNMIFVDPTAAPDGQGLVSAPVLTFEQTVAKFAA
jgi:hypothetical protein